MHAVLAAATAMLAFATLAVAQCCCWLVLVCALEALQPLEALVLFAAAVLLTLRNLHR